MNMVLIAFRKLASTKLIMMIARKLMTMHWGGPADARRPVGR